MADLKLKLIFDMVEKVTAPMKAISVGSKAMASDLRASQAEMKDLSEAQAKLGRFRELNTGLRDTRRELDQAEVKLNLVAMEMRQTENPTRSLTREFEQAQRAAAGLSRKMGDQQREANQLQSELRQSDHWAGTFGDTQRELAAKIDATSGAIDAQKAKLNALNDQEQRNARANASIDSAQSRGAQIAGAGVVAVGAGVAIGAPIVAATDSAMDFQATMVDVQKVIDDISPAQMKVLEDGIIDLGARMPVPIEGLGQIAAEGARAGIAADQLMPFVENAGMMAASFDIAADEAGAMMATWRKGLDLTIPQTAELGDKINALTNSFGGSAPRVAEMVTSVGPLGKIAGVASGEMAAMAQLMNSIGVESRVGSTGIKNFMLTMASGEGASSKQTAAFRNLGLEASEMARMMKEDARGAILTVLDALQQLPEEQQAGALTNLFGRESVGAIAPLLANLDDLKKNFELVGDAQNYAGSMSAEFDTAMSKTENQVATATGAISGVATTLGLQLLPIVDAIAGKVRIAAQAIGGWMREHPGLTKAIGIGATVIAGLLILIGGIAIVVGSVLGPFVMLKFALMGLGPAGVVIKALSGAFGFLAKAIVGAGKLMLANPIIAVIAAIALAAYLIYTHWDTLKPYFEDLWAQIKAIWAPFGEFFGALWEGVVAVFSGVFTVIKAILFTFTPLGLIYRHWDTIAEWFGLLWDGVKAVFATLFDWAAAAFLNFTPAGLIIKHWDSITPWFGALWEGVKAVFGTLFDWAKSAFLNFTPAGLIFKHWDVLGPFFADMWEGAKAIFSDAWGVIEQAAEGNFNPANILFDRWQAITTFFGTLWTRVRTVFSEKWTSIRTMIGEWPGKMLTLGTDMIGRLVAGIKAAPGAVWNALRDIVVGGFNRARELVGLGPVAASAPQATGLPKLAGARAAGGPVGAGQMYLVGEEGPEFFIPGANGSIVPNGLTTKLAGALALGGAAFAPPALASGQSDVDFASPPSFSAPANLSGDTARQGSSGDAASGPLAERIEMHFHGVSAKDADEIAEAVEDALEKLERKRRSDRRAEYRDDD